MDSKRKEELEIFQNELTYLFKNSFLLNQALTHKSFVNENIEAACEDNEKMEFLGDAVLDLVISDYIIKKYPHYPEGDLSKLRSAVVSESSLVKIAKGIDLGKYLLLGKGEEQSGGREKKSLLANALEAIIAAIYLDSGLNEANKFIIHQFAKTVAESVKTHQDYKTSLQEYTQREFNCVPHYRVVTECGPDHKKTFEIEVVIKNNMSGKGIGNSKKEAEQKSAEDVLKRIQGKKN